MRFFLQYFFWLLSLGTLVIFYFLNTLAGHQSLGLLVEDFLSQKTYNKIRVHSLNLEQYPHLLMELEINDRARVFLKGEVSKYDVNMSYHLVGETFKFNNFEIQYPLNVKGRVSGYFSKLHVDGKGALFDGKVAYDFVKVPTHLEAMRLKMKQVESEKVLEFLKQKSYVAGLVDMNSTFSFFSKDKKEGSSTIHMSKALMPEVAPNVPFMLNGVVDFEEFTYNYRGDILSNMGSLNISNGVYEKRKKMTTAKYDLHLKELSYFEKFLKHKFKGPLKTQGEVVYNDGLVVKGVSNKFGGVLGYVYEKEKLKFDFKGLSLTSMLAQFSYPALISSKVYGTIDYDMKEKMVLINTDLKKTRFRHTRLTQILYDKTGIDLLSEVYNQSSFSAGFQNSMLSSILKIDNGKSHIYLTDTKMNARNNKVNSKFEIKMQGQEIYGDIYGTLKDPKISVDMKRFLKYEMGKQLGGWFGTQKREAVKKELGEVKRDVTKKLKQSKKDDVTKSVKRLMDSFF